MMKKFLALLLALILSFSVCACSQEEIVGTIEFAEELANVLTAEDTATQAASPETLDEDGWYYSADDVGLYLVTYGHLPENFITKDEARELGWEGGSVEDYAPGYAIGGDRFGNREELLPTEDIYYECDIDTDGESSRGAKRIVFSDDGDIYYTEDHYESFTLLYEGE